MSGKTVFLRVLFMKYVIRQWCTCWRRCGAWRTPSGRPRSTLSTASCSPRMRRRPSPTTDSGSHSASSSLFSLRSLSAAQLGPSDNVNLISKINHICCCYSNPQRQILQNCAPPTPSPANMLQSLPPLIMMLQSWAPLNWDDAKLSSPELRCCRVDLP